MEQQNDEVARLFTPGEDYVAFDSLSELVDRIRYFLAHPQERERIARSGCARANQLYSAQVFWSRLFERAGIKPG